MRRRIVPVLITLLAGPAGAALAQGHYGETDHVHRAYNGVLEGRLTEATLILDSLSETDPNNLFAHYIGDLCDFVRLVITESEEHRTTYTTRWERRMDILRSGDADSPWHLFTQAELYLHAALISFKFGDNFDAAMGINKAFRLLKRNERRYPDFAPNLKDLGLLRAGVGTIPDEYRWAIKLVSSLEGTVPEGLTSLRSAIRLGRKDHSMLLPEMHLYYALALLHFGNFPAQAWDHLATLSLDPHASPITAFVYANVAMKTGHNDAAIEILQQRSFHRDAVPVPYLDFMLGSALLYRNDPDADLSLLRFAQDFNGENYLKEAFQKLAWHSLIHGDQDGYSEYMEQCLSIGVARTDEDKHALEEALKGEAPHPDLLRARLLFDGGYYSPAIAAMESVHRDGLSAQEGLEYTYRMGRILHAVGKEREALEYYERTIENGRETPYYFACNAALQSGLLYEQHHAFDQAEEYFRICLSLNPVDYRASLHQKAKAGLSRLRRRN